MERKIGEIFEYNGEWYQCVEGTGCYKCDFNIDENTCIADNPHCTCRSDKKNVIFKKLEKVGEPYSCNYYGDNRLIMMQEYNLYNLDDVTNEDKIPMYITDYKHKRIAIEIKQTKENMEQEIEYFGDENNNAKHSNPESVGKNLRPFDLQKAREGKPVCTRDGRKARIICFDKKEGAPIVALVEVEKNERVSEEITLYYINGRAISKDIESKDDLMMLTEKKEGWVNVYYDNDASSHRGCRFIYDTKERAVKEAGSNYITTVKINWEE